jgi:ABC-type antimicrobial peptide transport system permease subunit
MLAQWLTPSPSSIRERVSFVIYILRRFTHLLNSTAIKTTELDTNAINKSVKGSASVVRAVGPEESVMRAVRDRISRIDPAIPADLAFLKTHANQATASRRFMMTALSVFGGLSLLLAAMGVYGVLSFAAAQRTREIAIRAALGADRQRLVRLVLDSGARVIMLGLGLGLVGSWYLMQLVRGFLFQIEPRDPLVFGVAILTIVLVGVLAALIPARRASRVDPMQALRSD